MKCTLGCNTLETQYHIFDQCSQIFNKIRLRESIKLDKIYGTLEDQKTIIKSFVQIDDARKDLIEKKANSD